MCCFCRAAACAAATATTRNLGLFRENAQTPREAFDAAYRYHNYWKNNGGLTVSGGEPLLQIEFLTELFRLAKQKGVHTTLDTCGQPFTRAEPFYSQFCELMQYTDLVMLDIKEWDSARHKALTGHGNENILDMARWLSDHGKDMWVRHVLVPGLTDDAGRPARDPRLHRKPGDGAPGGGAALPHAGAVQVGEARNPLYAGRRAHANRGGGSPRRTAAWHRACGRINLDAPRTAGYNQT